MSLSFFVNIRLVQNLFLVNVNPVVLRHMRHIVPHLNRRLPVYSLWSLGSDYSFLEGRRLGVSIRTSNDGSGRWILASSNGLVVLNTGRGVVAGPCVLVEERFSLGRRSVELFIEGDVGSDF